LQDLLQQYWLTKKIIAYVKNKVSNLNIMTNALKSVGLQLWIFGRGGMFLRHIFWTCLFLMFIDMQLLMKKCARVWNMFPSNLHWFAQMYNINKRLREGRQDWKKTCIYAT
jgi:hypothetical protein